MGGRGFLPAPMMAILVFLSILKLSSYIQMLKENSESSKADDEIVSVSLKRWKGNCLGTRKYLDRRWDIEGE